MPKKSTKEKIKSIKEKILKAKEESDEALSKSKLSEEQLWASLDDDRRSWVTPGTEMSEHFLNSLRTGGSESARRKWCVRGTGSLSIKKVLGSHWTHEFFNEKNQQYEEFVKKAPRITNEKLLGKFESWAKGFEYRVAQGRVQIFQDALSREEAKLKREGGGSFLERYDQLISVSVIGLLIMLLLSWCDSLPLSEEGKQKKRYMY